MDPTPSASWKSRLSHQHGMIAVLSLAAILLHLLLRFGVTTTAAVYNLPVSTWPLTVCLVVGGIPLVIDICVKLMRLELGADLLAGLSIITSVWLGEYLAGVLIVLMLSGGEVLQQYAVRRASSVLAALARRMPAIAHLKQPHAAVTDLPLEEVGVGDTLIVFPHEICPVDGTVLEGHGVMDESYLTGEPYMMSKTPGSAVLSGAINGEQALTIQATKRAVDSRYATIMQVMQAAEQRRPRIRRLGDTLGTFYAPLALGIATLAWALSGEPMRFLAVLVVATPCPLLIAIPVTIIGAISLAAKQGIIIKDPAVLEGIQSCRTAIFDKTGTLTYGRPTLTEMIRSPGFTEQEVLTLVASLEQYSKHPLARAILEAATQAGVHVLEASDMRERPGEGLQGTINGRTIWVTSRQKLVAAYPGMADKVPPHTGGLECHIVIDDTYAATCRFHDQPRTDGPSFINHLQPKHGFQRIMIVSGDRESEVRYLAEQVGIDDLYFSQSPEQKLALVRAETQRTPTVFMGDGINDAPALTAATVGIAFGQHSDITAEAAGAVIMENSLKKVDEFLHVSRRMRVVALQSAVGGMALSVVGMLFAAGGHLPPVAGALMQEMIDVVAVLNALRVSFPPTTLSDY